MKNTSIEIPTLVRIKPGAVDRLGIYARRANLQRVVLLFSQGLSPALIERVQAGLTREGSTVLLRVEVASSSLEQAQEIFQSLPVAPDAVIGLGGGKALDVSKYVAFLMRCAYIAVPTSLSNDGFCSPQCSLEVKGKRRSLPAAMPYGVVVDTEVCLKAPRFLWAAGIGDSVAKITAVYDWKLAFRARETQVNDFAALLSEATVFQLIAKSDYDLEGIRLLATALALSGIAMEICGSSRPASGSEHLISHALDLISTKPRMHGLQVGVAAYLVSQLQGQGTALIAGLFDRTGFWDHIRAEPFLKKEWLEAFKMAPSIKPDFYTVLSEKDYSQELAQLLENDPKLQGLFV